MVKDFNLWDKYDFCEIYNFLDYIFPYYLKINPDENLKKFYEMLLNELDNFAKGHCKEDNMIMFYLDYRTDNEYHYIDFNMESEIITLSEGGSIYDPSVGSDSYQLWSYTLCNDGYDDGTLELDIYGTIEFINIGAKIHIEQPEEFNSTAYDEDEDDED